MGHVRVSTDMQATEGMSLEAQQSRIRMVEHGSPEKLGSVHLMMAITT